MNVQAAKREEKAGGSAPPDPKCKCKCSGYSALINDCRGRGGPFEPEKRGMSLRSLFFLSLSTPTISSPLFVNRASILREDKESTDETVCSNKHTVDSIRSKTLGSIIRNPLSSSILEFVRIIRGNFVTVRVCCYKWNRFETVVTLTGYRSDISFVIHRGYIRKLGYINSPLFAFRARITSVRRAIIHEPIYISTKRNPSQKYYLYKCR